MTDKIGDLTLDHVTGYHAADNTVTLTGFCSTRAALDLLREMFRKAVGNVTVNNLIGGREIGYDVTPDSALTKYCQFDSDKLYDGWYMLIGIDYPPRNDSTNYYPYTLKLFYMGSNSGLIQGFSLSLMEDEDNDWEI